MLGELFYGLIDLARELISDSPPKGVRKEKICPVCNGNDMNMYCPYRGENKRRCIRDERLKNERIDTRRRNDRGN